VVHGRPGLHARQGYGALSRSKGTPEVAQREGAEMSRHKKVHNILGDELGGTWRKADIMERWYCDEKDFSVYRSCETVEGTTKLVYRRSDNMEIIYRPYMRKC